MQIVPIRADLFHYLQDTVASFFLFEPDEYRDWDASKYHALVANAQRLLRWEETGQRLADSVGYGDRPLGRLYLRAARPNTEGQESVGWHREEFYGSPKGTLNFWMPVMGVNFGNAIKYVPGSDTIPDSELILEHEKDPTVTKGSDGNEIGLLYAPKRIVGGVDFDKAVPLIPEPGYAAIFSGSLIHGAAVNRGPDIRFSVDFRIYPEGYVDDRA